MEFIKKLISEIENTKDIENIESILSYGDLGLNIKEVLSLVKKIKTPNLESFTKFCNDEYDLFIPSWVIDAYIKSK